MNRKAVKSHLQDLLSFIKKSKKILLNNKKSKTEQRYPDRRFRNGHYDRRRLGRRIPWRQHHPRRGDPFQGPAPLHEKTAAVLAER